MQTWYQSSALEADYYRQKAQVNHKKMAMDPRTHKPFRDENALAPVSGEGSNYKYMYLYVHTCTCTMDFMLKCKILLCFTWADLG